MAAHARSIARLCVLVAAAAALGGCGSIGDPVGYSIVTQDKFDFMECREIINNRNVLTNREKELTALSEKAESSPGGFIVSAAAYRSELVQTRASLNAAIRAAREKGCDAKKP